MKKSLLLLMTVFCVLFASDVFADKTVSLPTTAYRTHYQMGNFKVEYTYDDYGHVILEKKYLQVDNDYILDLTTTYEYHQLPNGNFVKIKEESGNSRYTAAYDDNGMQLFEQREVYFGEPHGWRVAERTEAVVDDNGIRIGVREYDSENQPDAGFTFDSKGRVIEASGEEEGDGEDENIVFTWKYTWGADGVISAASYQNESESISFQNITTVLNKEYYNEYSLFPIGEDDSVYDFTWVDTQKYNWDDYTLQKWFYNADVTLNGQSGSVQTTVNDTEGEITFVLDAPGVEKSTEIYKKLSNGGWSLIEKGDDETDYETVIEYNEHGALIREYTKDYDYDGEGAVMETNHIYNREYDAQGRPVKTTFLINDTPQFEETYDSWVSVIIESSGLEEMNSLSAVSVYPNPAADYITVELTENAKDAFIQLFDSKGVLVLSRPFSEGQNISVSHLSNGLYLIKAGDYAGKLLISK